MQKIVIIPAPRKFEQEALICLGGISSVKWNISAPHSDDERVAEAVRVIKKAFSEIAASNTQSETEDAYSISLEISNFDGCESQEDYKIVSSEAGAVLTAASPAGLFYAAITFSKILTADAQMVYIAKCKIYDGPAYKHRGLLQETRFDTEFLSINDWHDIIDLYSDLKFNQLTIAVYGCWDIQYDMKLSQYAYLPLKNTDKLKTNHNIKYYSAKEGKWVFKEKLEPEMYRQDYFSDIIRYGKKRNVNVKPLFNSLGHNTLLPQQYPEISALDENGVPKKFGLCLSNPETYKRLFTVYDEIIDRYLIPNGITSMHIGLDEYRPEYNVDKNDITASVSHICHCEKCSSREYQDLIFEYTLKLVKYLKSRGVDSVHIYHDMFFGKDYSDKTFINMVKEEGLYDNVVIEWWDYGPDDEKYYRRNRKNVNSDLRSIIKPMCGYFGWVIPTTRHSNIRGAARLADEISCEGLDAYAAFEDSFDYEYTYLSEMAWTKYGNVTDEEVLGAYTARHFGANKEAFEKLDLLLKMSFDNGLVVSLFEYYFHGYIRPSFDIPRNFPGDVFKKIKTDPDKYIAFLEKARSAFEDCFLYFNSLDHKEKTNIFRLYAKHYYVLANEYLTLYGIENEYALGKITAAEVSEKLGKLISEREGFMILTEGVRRESTRLTYLRNASIFRQYLLDFKCYVDLCIERGEDLKIELENPSFKGSDIFYALR